MDNFSRVIPLIKNFDKLKEKWIAIVGVGGVGGVVAVALARSGVCNFILCDFDKVNESNINRQVVAFNSTIGMYKVDVLENKIKDINKDANVLTIKEPFNENSPLFNHHIDFLVDAIDDVDNKYLLIKETLKRNIPLISSMGTAKKTDIKKLAITNINQTSYDPLAKIIRKKLRDNGDNYNFKCLSSTEVVSLPGSTLASYMPVTASAGLMIADYVIKKIGEEENE